jgi:hypothetical protein
MRLGNAAAVRRAKSDSDGVSSARRPGAGPVARQLVPAAGGCHGSESGIPCPPNPTPTNCFFQLTLAATSWSISFVATGGTAVPSQGDVVVNNDEIDFFNSVYCGLQLPNGLGRFTWRVTAGVLYFTLISDTCTRAHVLTNRGWSRTH